MTFAVFVLKCYETNNMSNDSYVIDIDKFICQNPRMHEEPKDQSNEVQAKSERKMLSPHMTYFPSNKSYHPHRMNTKHKSDANLPIDGIMHFPALRRLLDVRNSIQSLEVLVFST